MRETEHTTLFQEKPHVSTTLVIPLPITSSGETPTLVSYRWCKSLFDALTPLLVFKCDDGSNALHIAVAAEWRKVAYCGDGWDVREERGFEDGMHKFVCRIMLMQSSRAYVDVVWFGLDDFIGDAHVAREKFAQVIKHLEQHAVPQIAPEWIGKVLAMLAGE